MFTVGKSIRAMTRVLAVAAASALVAACGEGTPIASVIPTEETVSLQQFGTSPTCTYVFPRFGTAFQGTEISIYGGRLSQISQIRVGTLIITDFNQQTDTVITFSVPDFTNGEVLPFGRPVLTGPNGARANCPTSIFLIGNAPEPSES